MGQTRTQPGREPPEVNDTLSLLLFVGDRLMTCFRTMSIRVTSVLYLAVFEKVHGCFLFRCFLIGMGQ